MKNYFNKIKTYISLHKTISIIALIVILLIGYWGYKKITNTGSETSYVTAQATSGTILSLVSGSGQVSALNQINITPTVSGTITNVKVNPGDPVKRGQTLFTIDDTSAQSAVRDASANLESAKLALETAQAQNGNTDTNQKTTIANAYNALLNSNFEAVPNNISDKTTTNLSAPIISGNYILGKEGTVNIHFYQSNGGISFEASGLTDGNSIGSASFPEPIGDSGLFLTLPSNSNSLTSTDWVINIPNTNASNYVSNYNAYQAALQAQNQSSSNSNVSQLNIQGQELAVTKAENALADAQNTLADCYVQAPFDGVMASVPVIVGDSASSGTTLGTLITPTQVAVISLNEVDVAKIALGQKVTLTFDAIPDLTISGKVAQIDSVGTVSSGVVNYNVKISFDTSDSRVKPGMSVNADIITNIKQDVLTIPNSAVKTQNGTSYVQIFTPALPAPITGVQGTPSTIPPVNQVVQIGISDDTNTEIISGLKEGDQVVVKTIAGSSASTTTTSAPSLLSAVSGNRGATGGGAARALGR